MKEIDIRRELEVQRRRVDKRTPSDSPPPRVTPEKEVPPNNPSLCTPAPEAPLDGKSSERPQPIDFGLTCDDLNLYDEVINWWVRLKDGGTIQCLAARPDDKYRK